MYRVVPSIRKNGMYWLPEPTCSFAFLSHLSLGWLWTTLILCSYELKFYSRALDSRKTSRNSSGLANQTSPWHPVYNRNVPKRNTGVTIVRTQTQRSVRGQCFRLKTVSPKKVWVQIILGTKICWILQKKFGI